MESKKQLLTIQPEWEPKLDRLKRELFYAQSNAAMMRYLIALGIETATAQLETSGAKEQG